jgi:plasmid stability protein
MIALIAMLSLAMASITIRRLDDTIKAKLRVRAASHGRSMEEEVREILKASLRLNPERRLNLAESIRRHFAPFGGVELVLRPRDAVRRPPKLAT